MIKCRTTRCDANLDGKDNYCPLCGRLANRIVEGLKLEIAHPEPSVVFSFTLESDTGFFRSSLDGDARVKVSPEKRNGRSVTYDLDISKLEPGQEAHLTLTTNCGERKDIWTIGEPETHHILVHRSKDQFEPIFVPGQLIFESQTDLKSLRIRNTSRIRRQVTVSLPTGYIFEGEGNVAKIWLEPNKDTQMWVQPTKTGELRSGIAFMTSDNGSPIASACRFSPSLTRGQGTTPTYVVGIDFGTSSTSVFAYKTIGLNPSKPESLLGNGPGESRPRTQIKVSKTEDWGFFNDYLGSANDDEVISDIKTLLRNDTKKVTRNGEEYDVMEVVQRALEYLLRVRIEPYLNERNAAGHLVEFVFTVPVLDGNDGEQNRKYKAKLEEAARLAGYQGNPAHNKNYRIRFELEPNAAAKAVAAAAHEGKRSFADNQTLLVLDFGAGTIDACYGVLRTLGNRFTLESPRNFRIHLNEHEIGGNVIDYEMGRWHRVYPAPRNNRARVEAAMGTPEFSQRMFYIRENYARAGSPFMTQNPPTDGSYDESISFEVFDQGYDDEKGILVVDPDNFEPRCWFHRFPDLRTFITSAKIQMSGDSGIVSAADPKGQVPDHTEEAVDPTIVFRPCYRGAVATVLAGVENSIREFLDEIGIGHRHIDHVALVGGSSRLPEVKALAERMFGYDTVIPPGLVDVDTAVCIGATQIYRLPAKGFLFDLSYEFQDENVILARKGETFTGVREKSFGVLLHGGQRERLTLSINYAEESLLDYYDLEGPLEGHVSIQYSLKGVKAFFIDVHSKETELMHSDF